MGEWNFRESSNFIAVTELDLAIPDQFFHLFVLLSFGTEIRIIALIFNAANYRNAETRIFARSNENFEMFNSVCPVSDFKYLRISGEAIKRKRVCKIIQTRINFPFLIMV